ncbi:3-mercaptopyruvate sulfurtransferase [Phenylobacterium sp.]|uniref:3-mercaptopyruvate sulfurtransferase n=1 Tax=Phenylobacterium sp. TaxID=1871053 RepID=UPI0028110CE9|nr:3-mercaptopyruvate sulfurtransferase [Phenylobacterium sp.]
MDPMVSTDWLEAHLYDADLRVVDATLPLVGQPGHGRDTYEVAHIPGAVFFDINAVADRSTDLPHMLPAPEAFAKAAGELGLGRDATIVVYDAHGLYSAPRVWWTLRTMGYPRVFVLDGGLRKWRAEGRVVTSEAAQPAPTAADTAFRPELVRDLVQVQAHLQAGDAQLLDARSTTRFRGQAPEPRAGLRSGHMPGALNLPFDEVVNPDGTLKSEGELRPLFEDVGIDLSRAIVTTCGSGVTAAVLALALARLGRDDVAVYDGSWTEWGGRPDTAVVTGA